MVIHQMFLIHIQYLSIQENIINIYYYICQSLWILLQEDHFFFFSNQFIKSVFVKNSCSFFTWYILKEKWKILKEHSVTNSSTHCIYNTILQRSAIIEILNSGTNGGTVSKFLFHPIVYHLFQTSVTIANATLYLKA